MLPFFIFEVHTPYRIFFDSNKVQAFTLPLADGEIGVYARHSPVTAITVTGILRIKDAEDKWKAAFVSGGILEVKEFKNVLMVSAAEWPDEIDRERALMAKQRAEIILAEAEAKVEIDRAREKLRRAEFRLKLTENR